MLHSNPKNLVYFYHNGNQYRDFLYIEDAVNGIIQTIKNNPKSFNIFNISSQTKISPKQITKIIESISTKRIFYKLKNEKNNEKCIWADNTKSFKILKFIPKTSFELGLNKMLSL